MQELDCQFSVRHRSKSWKIQHHCCLLFLPMCDSPTRHQPSNVPMCANVVKCKNKWKWMFASVSFTDTGIAKSKITASPLPYVCLLFLWTQKASDADSVIDMLWQLYSNDFYILKWNRFATELIHTKGFSLISHNKPLFFLGGRAFCIN